MKKLPMTGQVFYNSDGTVYDHKGLHNFTTLSNNSNLLIVHLEDAHTNDEINLINFTPRNAYMIYSTHWFYLTPLGTTLYKKESDNNEKLFYTYGIILPNIVLGNSNTNSNESGGVVNDITVIKRDGVKNLGIFNNLIDLDDEITRLFNEANEVEVIYNTIQDFLENLFNQRAFAYIIDENSFYQVEYFENSYQFIKKQEVVNYGDVQKQYDVKDIFIKKGFSNSKNIPDISTTVTQALMQVLNSMQTDLNLILEGYIINVSGTSTDTTNVRVGNLNANEKDKVISVDVKIDNANNDLLEVTSEGLYVKHDDTKVNQTDFNILESIVEGIELNDIPNINNELARLETEKADQITTYTKNEVANLLLGKLDVEGDGSAKVDMPASIKNRNVVNVEYLLAKILEESLVVDGKLLLKVNTFAEIAGLPIGNGITMDNLVNQLRLASDEAKGLLSAEHYDLLMTLDGLLDNGEDTQFVDTIREVLEILENYPEGANLAQQLGVIEQNILALQNNKADKSITINGFDLSQNRVIHGDKITYNYPQDVRIDNKSVQEVSIETLNKFLNYYLKGETYSAIEIDNKISETLYHGVFIADLGNFTDVDIDQLIDLGGF